MRKMLLLLVTLFIGIQVFAQTTITGKVTDEEGMGIPGANVMVKGVTGVGTITNFEGKYTIEVPVEGTALVISSVGLETQEIEVDGKSIINTSLKVGNQEIDEVVVTAYGKASKKSLVGAQVSIDSKTLEKIPVTNVSNALAGAAPGVQVTTSGGQPGSGSDIMIRGFGSINASSSPLIIVDGAAYSGNLSDISSSDIESFSVLKDAASTSIYGSSAGNGVVLITTKSGSAKKEGKPTFTFTTHQGFSARGMKKYETVNAMQYYPLMWQQWYNENKYARNMDDEAAAGMAMYSLLEDFKDINPYVGVKSVYEYNPGVGFSLTDNPSSGSLTVPAIVTPDGKLNPQITGLKWEDDLDWENALFRTGIRSEYLLSGSHSTDKLKSFMSLGHVKEEGYRIETSMKRYTGRLNVSYKLNKAIELGTNVSLSNAELNSPKTASGGYSSNSFNFVKGIAPIYPVHLHDYADGSYVLDANGNKIYNYYSADGFYALDKNGNRVRYNSDRNYNSKFNPVYESYIDLSTRKRTAINTRSFATLNILPSLKLTTNISYDLYNSASKKRFNNVMGDQPQGLLKISNFRSTTVTFNQLLNYTKIINKHRFEFLLGHENYLYNSSSLSADKEGMGLLGLDEMANLIKPSDISSGTTKYRKEGYFARLRYSFAGRYNLSGSYRRDGTSRLHKDYRWGNFWSVGAGWQIKEESFLKDVFWVNHLKLRASYGQTGNDGFLTSRGYQSYYPYQTTYGLGNNNFDRMGLRLNSFAMESLLWETQTSSDVALEFGFFRRIQGTVELFNKESKDLIFSFPLPVSTGIGSVNKNLGKVRNYGIEMDITAYILKSENLSWSLNWNGTMLKNEIVTLPEENRKDGIEFSKTKYMEGKSKYEFFLREWIGVDPENGKAMYRLDKEKYTTVDGIEPTGEKSKWTYNATYARKHYCGSSIPKLYGGFGTNVVYRQIDLGAKFAYQLGGKMYDGAYKGLMGSALKSGKAMHVDMLKAWKKPGDITDVPRLDAGADSKYDSSTSDRFLISSNALMLKSVSLGYTLPNEVAQSIHVKNLRVSVTAENMFLLSKRKGLNPMMNYRGVSGSSFYDYSRTFIGSLTFTF